MVELRFKFPQRKLGIRMHTHDEKIKTKKEV
jgi:hypothetical protein